MIVLITKDFKDKDHRNKLRKRGALLEVPANRGKALIKAGVGVEKKLETIETKK